MRMDGAVARADDLLARLEEAANPLRQGAGAGRPLRAALRREQDVWLLDYDGRSVCLQNAKGLQHMAALLAEPGRSISALDLAGGEAGRLSERMKTLRARAAELREELGEAQAFNDPERIFRARRQLERLATDVARAESNARAAGERARINVTRAIKAAVARIAEHEPQLAHLLRGTVRTGTACVYEPDPGAPLSWDVRR
jgi:non-specific serine/threonine protein kinase